ncbi:protein FAM214A isoform X1 [Labeo rohita]|uniref:Atos homolog protein A n=1 Tax=Labeo rohita TaxID=84645 RepID=A0A498N3W0_LABRO|nr:protein FAM214A isoform X1 [Labeo rohita]
MSKGRVLKSKQRSEDGRRTAGILEGITVSVTNMKPDRASVWKQSADLRKLSQSHMTVCSFSRGADERDDISSCVPVIFSGDRYGSVQLALRVKGRSHIHIEALGGIVDFHSKAEEFFEYDAEEFLVFLTLLITEGRTPECSVKGRTEGVHCPPAQSAMPVLTKHECSDKIPQCRQARRTRSEVMLLWRNHIPIMIEVMLLPDCCYSDEGPTTDCTDLNDPAIKQDALLLERWTLQPVPRQSGDRFIEEKTLLLAVRSYVFFSQLSAWLSASHGLVPRNILYRISAADEELIWNFSQTPSEHAFPVPNVSHSVALKVRVQSLPRQPKYPVLKCSIHSGIAFLGKRSLERGEGRNHAGENRSSLRLPGSPLFSRPLRPSPPPHSPLNTRKCPSRPESPLPPGKAVKWLYSRLNGGVDASPTEACTDGAESPKTSNVESPIRGFKSLSITDPLVNPSPSPSSISGETNPLIGSLLQERQEVIARIAQRLNLCDPTAPHLPDALFASQEPPAHKTTWSSSQDKERLKKSKEPLFPIPQPHNGTSPEVPERSRSSLFDTPLSPRSRKRLDRADCESKTSPKLSTCRRLILSDQSAEGSLIADAVQDISRLIQERLQHSYSLLNGTYKLKTSQTEQVDANHGAQTNGFVSSSHEKSSSAPNGEASTDPRVSQATKCCRSPDSSRRNRDCSPRPQNVASLKLEDHSVTKSQPLTASNNQQYASRESWTSLKKNSSHASSPQENGLTQTGHFQPFKTQEAKHEKEAEKDVWDGSASPEKDENQKPWASPSSTPANLTLNTSSPAPAHRNHTRRPPSPLKSCGNWKKQNRHSIDGTATKAFHPCTGLPLLSSPVPQRKSQTGYFDLDTSLIHCRGVPWAANKRVLKRSQDCDETQHQILSASAPPASLSLLGNFEECVLNYRLEPLGTVEGFTAEVGASGTFCPSHMTLPVDVSFYSVSDDNAPSPYMGVINLESLGKRGYRVPPSGTIQVTLFNPNKTVVKMFVVMYDLREMPASHQTFLRQRTFSVPVKREFNGQSNKKPSPLSQGRTLRYLVHLRFQSSKSGKIYLHRDIRLLFSRKSMEVDSGAAYELKSFTESPADPPFSPRC